MEELGITNILISDGAPFYLDYQFDGINTVDLRETRDGNDWTIVSHTLDTSALQWTPWKGSGPAKITTDPPRVSSDVLVDAAVIAPITLEPGIYRFELEVSGDVDGPGDGPGGFSLHGKRKLLWIPAGHYEHELFSRLVHIGPEESVDYLSFGLGGWETGRGVLQMDGLTIKRIEYKRIDREQR